MAKHRNPTPEAEYAINTRRNIIIALEELNFVWCEDDAKEVSQMWRQGIPLEMIAANFDRDIDEVAVLIMHLCRKKRIKPRKGGIWGGK